jgi:hypothetical protein
MDDSDNPFKPKQYTFKNKLSEVSFDLISELAALTDNYKSYLDILINDGKYIEISDELADRLIELISQLRVSVATNKNTRYSTYKYAVIFRDEDKKEKEECERLLEELKSELETDTTDELFGKRVVCSTKKKNRSA